MKSQKVNYPVKKVQSGNFKFPDESVLESFIWDNLKELFQFTPLRRQHHVNGNYCDILAASKTNSLVIIELKNSEDRYVVQQTTRYYHELLTEKPYDKKVDYSQPIDLVIISPDFHKDNWTDKLYSKLKLKFIEFELLQKDKLYFHAQDAEAKATYQVEVPFVEPQSQQVIEIPDVPRTFNTGLSRCDYVDPSLLLAAREKILNFDPRIKEIQLSPGNFMYGKGKTKPCAQIIFGKRKSGKRTEDIFDFGLWLPIALYSYDVRSRVTRVMVSGMCGTREVNCLEELLMQKGIGRTRKTSDSWRGRDYLCQFLRKELNEEIAYRKLNPHIRKYCELKGYSNPTKGNREYMEFFISIALDTWKRKLDGL